MSEIRLNVQYAQKPRVNVLDFQLDTQIFVLVLSVLLVESYCKHCPVQVVVEMSQVILKKRPVDCLIIKMDHFYLFIYCYSKKNAPWNKV